MEHMHIPMNQRLHDPRDLRKAFFEVGRKHLAICEATYDISNAIDKVRSTHKPMKYCK